MTASAPTSAWARLMKTKLAAFFLLLTGALIYQAPARLILLFSSSIPMAINSHQIHGSLWRGEINNITVTTPSGNYPIEQLQWSLELAQILRLKTSIVIAARSSMGEFTGRLHYLDSENFRLSEGQLNLAAEQLQPWFDYGQVSGEIIGENISAVFEKDQLRSLNADVTWHKAKLQILGSDWALGDLSFTLSEQQGIIHIDNSDNTQSILLQAQLKNPNQPSARILGKLSFNTNNSQVKMARQQLPEPLAKKILRQHLLNFSLHK